MRCLATPRVLMSLWWVEPGGTAVPERVRVLSGAGYRIELKPGVLMAPGWFGASCGGGGGLAG